MKKGNVDQGCHKYETKTFFSLINNKWRHSNDFLWQPFGPMRAASREAVLLCFLLNASAQLFCSFVVWWRNNHWLVPSVPCSKCSKIAVFTIHEEVIHLRPINIIVAIDQLRGQKLMNLLFLLWPLKRAKLKIVPIQHMRKAGTSLELWNIKEHLQGLRRFQFTNSWDEQSLKLRSGGSPNWNLVLKLWILEHFGTALALVFLSIWSQSPSSTSFFEGSLLHSHHLNLTSVPLFPFVASVFNCKVHAHKVR